MKNFKEGQVLDVMKERLAETKKSQIKIASFLIKKGAHISFKNMKEGFIAFATKEKTTSRKRNTGVSPAIIQQFSQQLNQLIREICDPSIPFTEKIA